MARIWSAVLVHTKGLGLDSTHVMSNIAVLTRLGLLCELAANAGRVLTHDQLLQRVWGLTNSGGSGPVRTAVKNLRRKLGDDADSRTYIFKEPRVGYRMPKGETPGQGEE